MRFLPVTTNALLVELTDLEQTLSLLASLQRAPLPGVVELVPAARTILVSFRPWVTNAAALVNDIARRDLSQRIERSDVLIEIPVRYDGEDLDEVAQMLGISREEVVRRHTGSEYTVAFTGFAPGFAYLSGGHPSLDVPRRKTPRTRIPAGGVGLAGTFSGVYPHASPGGWQILGVTPLTMWDTGREQPALLQPGYRVRFVDIATLDEATSPLLSEAVRTAGAAASATPVAQMDRADASSGPALKVKGTGLLTVFQDLGRHGQAGQGVSASGAMDQSSLKTANRLAGNASDLPALETIGGGLQLQSVGENVVAVAGADAPLTLRSADGRQWPVPAYQPIALADGDTLTIGQPVSGARCYVAARGGFAVEPVLGSCATDTLAKVGPEPLAVGDVLRLRPAPASAVVGAAVLPPENLPSASEDAALDVVLDVVLGPRTDWFTAESVARLTAQRWQVTPQSNRVGLRLQGESPLERALSGELPSEGTVLGALQVPPSGQPVLFLADHPLTGGYPVIGAVAPHHLDRAGQIPVGAWLRFNVIRAFEELQPSAG